MKGEFSGSNVRKNDLEVGYCKNPTIRGNSTYASDDGVAIRSKQRKPFGPESRAEEEETNGIG